MRRFSKLCVGITVAAMLCAVASGMAEPKAAQDDNLAAFNAKFREVILRMDSAGAVALWADDGVSLMPDAEPIVGKTRITKFMAQVDKDFAGYRVTKEEIAWKDARIAGDWASEWGVVHQEVIPPGNKPAIEVYGRIALVLHRAAGEWKIEQEVWQSAPKPAS
jgi:ketosteroid isomerase-like protein